MCMCLDSFLYSSSKIPPIMQLSQLTPVYYWTPESYGLHLKHWPHLKQLFHSCKVFLYGSIHNHLPSVLLSFSMAAFTTISQVYYWASLWQHSQPSPKCTTELFWSHAISFPQFIIARCLSACSSHTCSNLFLQLVLSHMQDPTTPHIPEQPPVPAGRGVSNTTLNHIIFWGVFMGPSAYNCGSTVDQLTTYYIAYNACIQACMRKVPSHI